MRKNNLINSISIHFGGQTFKCLPQKTLYWQEENALLLSDLHLGKAAHLRKNGFALSDSAQAADFAALKSLFYQITYAKVYILGDLYHSYTMADSDQLSQIIKNSGAEWILIAGNHDVFQVKTYQSIGFSEIKNQLVVNGILLKHETSKADIKSQPCISGHIHPGYLLKGKAKQALTLPCFYATNNHLILPAFGALTGLFRVKYNPKKDTVVVCLNNQLFKVD